MQGKQHVCGWKSCRRQGHTRAACDKFLVGRWASGGLQCRSWKGLHIDHDQHAIWFKKEWAAWAVALHRGVTWASFPAARLRCSKAEAAWCTTTARKAHMRMTLEDEVRRGVGSRLLRLVQLALWDFGSLARWKYYALCSQSLSLCFVVSATAPALLTRQ